MRAIEVCLNLLALCLMVALLVTGPYGPWEIAIGAGLIVAATVVRLAIWREEDRAAHWRKLS